MIGLTDDLVVPVYHVGVVVSRLEVGVGSYALREGSQRLLDVELDGVQVGVVDFEYYCCGAVLDHLGPGQQSSPEGVTCIIGVLGCVPVDDVSHGLVEVLVGGDQCVPDVIIHGGAVVP